MPTYRSQSMENEELNKSIDSLLDDLFADDNEAVVKSKNAIDEIVGAPKQTKKNILDEPEDDADKAVAKAPKSKSDKRPIAEVSDVPKTDEDGSRAKGYNAVQSNSTAKDVSNEKMTVAKGNVSISQEDFDFLQKAKADKEEEILQKAKSEQENLVKAIVETQTSDLKKALEDSTEIIKSLNEENQTLKARPRVQKSITSINELQTLEKGNLTPKTFGKEELLVAAESLHKSGKIRLEQVIELENNGTIYDPNARKLIEEELNKN